MKIKTIIKNDIRELDEAVSKFQEEQKVNFSQTDTFVYVDSVFHKITLFYDEKKVPVNELKLAEGVVVKGNTVDEKIISIEELE